MSRGHFPVSPHSSRVDQQAPPGTGRWDPPSRNRQKPIPLPVLADVPIIIHPLLAYTQSMLPIKYDITTLPATALLEPSMRSQPAFLRWRYHAAMEPSTIGSITIRIMEFDKPVVVLPSRLETNIVTIGDVLNSVYYATNTGAREAYYDGILDDPFQLWSQQQALVQGRGHTEMPIFFPKSSSQYQQGQVNCSIANVTVSRGHDSTSPGTSHTIQHNQVLVGNHPHGQRMFITGIQAGTTYDSGDLSSSRTHQRHRDETREQVTDLLGGRRHLERPPPLIVGAPIPLPALADGAILVHPLLAYHRSASSIHYDLTMPPSTALPMLPLKDHMARRYWAYQPAMEPSTVGSMTIRIAVLERPIVVFPARLDDSVVTVMDVLAAVYRAIRAAAMGDYDERGEECMLDNTAQLAAHPRRHNAISTSRDHCPNVAHITVAIRKHFGGVGVWAGLYPSPTERDVWILHTRQGDHR
ncbi:hypothetical protein BDZ97DRAFT_1923025 [Flammula alnicola]|nr:hypothetical protein BDZ97DRAFT_1923025 [Flammula alnicola]